MTKKPDSAKTREQSLAEINARFDEIASTPGIDDVTLAGWGGRRQNLNAKPGDYDDGLIDEETAKFIQRSSETLPDFHDLCDRAFGSPTKPPETPKPIRTRRKRS